MPLISDCVSDTAAYSIPDTSCRHCADGTAGHCHAIRCFQYSYSAQSDQAFRINHALIIETDIQGIKGTVCPDDIGQAADGALCFQDELLCPAAFEQIQSKIAEVQTGCGKPDKEADCTDQNKFQDGGAQAVCLQIGKQFHQGSGHGDHCQ